MVKRILGFSLDLADRPGALASVAEVIAKEGINIDACLGFKHNDKATIHFITNDSQAAVQALKSAGIKHRTQELLEIVLEDKPGELVKVSRALGDAKVNITALYPTMRKTIVLEVDNIASAAKVLEKLSL